MVVVVVCPGMHRLRITTSALSPPFAFGTGSLDLPGVCHGLAVARGTTSAPSQGIELTPSATRSKHADRLAEPFALPSTEAGASMWGGGGGGRGQSGGPRPAPLHPMMCSKRGGGGGEAGQGYIRREGIQTWSQRRVDRRLEGVAKAVGGGYCRLPMPLSMALAIERQWLGVGRAPWRGEEVPTPLSNASLGQGAVWWTPPRPPPLWPLLVALQVLLLRRGIHPVP